MNIQTCLHALQGSERIVAFLERTGQESQATYSEIYASALGLLGALQARGAQPGRQLVVLTQSVRARVTALWACWLGGIIPVSLPGFKPERLPELIERHDSPLILTDDISIPDALNVNRLTPQPAAIQSMDDGDTALLQYTSGTQGAPRAAMLSGANLYEGAKASSVVVRVGVRERYLAYLPIDHIFGLVANHLVPLYNDFDQYLIHTQRFLETPGVWLEKCVQFGATVTGSSQFGLERAAKAGLSASADLSSLNVCFLGGETLSAAAIEAFESRFDANGLRRGVVLPALGMSEATMGISYTPPGERVRVHRIDPASARIGGRLAFWQEGGVQRLCLGVLDDCNEVEIRDLEGVTLPPEHLGQIHVKGTNIFKGYYKGEPLPADGWFATGDLGFFKDGRLAVFARYKDVVCVNGANYAASDLERSAGLGASCPVCVVEGEDGLIVVCETQCAETECAGTQRAGTQCAETVRAAAEAISKAWGLRVGYGAVVDALPRGGKGQVDRFAAAQLVLQGKLELLATSAGGSGALPEECRMLADIWAAVLGIDVGELSGDSHFMLMGGDSLKLIDLACEIEERLGAAVDAEDLAGTLTLARMAEVVAEL